MAMRSTIKRVGVLLAALMMIMSCGGNDHPAAPVETSATPGLSTRSRRFWMGRGTSHRSKLSRSYARCA
jgi:hypothetical protein